MSGIMLGSSVGGGGGGGGGGSTTPIAWWDADDLELSDGDPVSSWIDNIGGLELAQATGANRPTYKAGSGIYNGTLPAVRFDGTNDRLTSDDASLPTGAITIIVVCKSSKTTYSADTYGVVLNYGAEGDGTRVTALYGTDANMGNNAFGWSNGGTTSGNGETVAKVITGKWLVGTISKNSGSWTARINRSMGKQAAAGSSTELSGELSVGSLIGSTSHFQGDIRHIIIYDRVLPESTVFARVQELLQEGEAPVTTYVSITGNDGTGQRGNQSLPFRTIAPALIASATASIHVDSLGSDTIHIGEGYFVEGIYVYNLISRVILQGSGQPEVDDEENPTALTGGTRIGGNVIVWDAADFKMYDCGIDVGSVYCDTYTSGTPQEALNATPREHVPVSDNLHKPGCEFKRLTALCKGSTTHASAFSNLTGCVIVDFECWLGFAAFVVEIDNSEITRTHGHMQQGEFSGGIYPKSNFYGFCFSNSFTDCQASDCEQGMYIVAEAGSDVYSCTFTGTVITNCERPLRVLCSGSYKFRDSVLDIEVTDGSTGDAVVLEDSIRIVVSGSVSDAFGDGIQIEDSCEDIYLSSDESTLVLNDNGGYGINNASTTSFNGGQISGTGNVSGLTGGVPLI